MVPPAPHLFVILGGMGDLAARKLLPALHDLMTGSSTSHVLGVGLRGQDDAGYRAWAVSQLAAQGLVDVGWTDRLHFHRIDQGIGSYEGLATEIIDLEGSVGLGGDRVFYLALPPGAVTTALEGLGSSGLHRSPGWTRLVVEKPFGTDLASAAALDEAVHRWFAEDQVFRIDHYLGKETVQNLLAFRFANPIFETSWNRDRIERVEITVAESVGVGSRAGYYDRAGVVRDMLQNHLTQLMALVAMEPPTDFTAEAIRDEKVKVLRSIDPLTHDDLRYAQYSGGEGHPGYLDEDEVPDGSQTPTFAEARLRIGTWRWQGVPFVLRSGKRLPSRETRIDVQFRHSPICLFHDDDGRCSGHGNRLSIILQPDEGFDLSFSVKTPGEEMVLVDQQLDFRYAEAYGPLTGAYTTLIRDVIEGDQTLFVRTDEVEASWRIWNNVLVPGGPIPHYSAGSMP